MHLASNRLNLHRNEAPATGGPFLLTAHAPHNDGDSRNLEHSSEVAWLNQMVLAEINSQSEGRIAVRESYRRVDIVISQNYDGF